MRPIHLSAFLILLYWQLGPLPAASVDTTGKVRWAISSMASAGTWEAASFDCNGDLVDSHAAPYRDIGARVDRMDPRSGLRVSAVGGITHRSDPYSYYGGTATFAGIQFALENPRLGLGAGVVSAQYEPAEPSLYLRLGRADHSHFRMEINPLSETRSFASAMRAGVGFRQGVAGLAFNRDIEKLSQATGFIDLSVPVSRHLDLRVAMQGGPGVRTSQWGLAGGLKVKF